MKHGIKKKTKSLFQKLFRSSSPSIGEENNSISYSVLRKMVRTKEHEDILKLIENETIPSVREAWIDYFLEKTKIS